MKIKKKVFAASLAAAMALGSFSGLERLNLKMVKLPVFLQK